MPTCNDCHYLRLDIRIADGQAPIPKHYGNFTYPCNRYPMNILRSPLEPACGEFKRKKPKKE